MTSSSSRKQWKQTERNQENPSRLQRAHSSPGLTTLGEKRNNSNILHGNPVVSIRKKSKISKSMSPENIFGGLQKTQDNGEHDLNNSSSSESSPDDEEDDEDNDNGINSKLNQEFFKTTIFHDIKRRMQGVNRNFADSAKVIKDLTQRLAMVEQQLKTVNNVNEENKELMTVFQVSAAQNAVLGILIRDKMFSSIKFLDNRMLGSQGNNIYQRCLSELGISQQKGNQVLEKKIMARVKRVLATHRGHASRDMLAATLSKYYLFPPCELYNSILTMNSVLKLATEIRDDLNNITWHEHIAHFRRQSWEETEEIVKSSWFLYCKYMLPAITRPFRKQDVMTNSLVSEVVSSSDEAFALISIKYKVQYWAKKGQEELETSNKSHEKSPLSDNQIAEYYTLFESVKEMRSNEETGKEWDQAFLDHISEEVNSVLVDRGTLLFPMQRNKDQADSILEVDQW
jgi:hypothetical protein